MTQSTGTILATPCFEGLESRIMLSGTPLSAMAEDGLASVAQVGRVRANHQATVVELARSFDNPVVIASRRAPRGRDATVVRISDVQADQFTLQLVEAPNCDGLHAYEAISFMVIEAGTWYTPEGKMIQAGTIDTAATVGAIGASWQRVSFGERFSNGPVVQAQIQSDNDRLGSHDFATTRMTQRNVGGFSVAMEHSDIITSAHQSETIGYVAVQGGIGRWDGRTFRAMRVGRTTSRWRTARFQRNLAGPDLWGQVSSYRDADNVTLQTTRLRRGDVRLRLQEDTTQNAETTHRAESVDVLALAGAGIFRLQRPVAPSQPADDAPVDPPADDAPVDPPADDPPADDTPADPPADDAPVDPPADDPPVDPPADDAPVDPPADDAPADPPAAPDAQRVFDGQIYDIRVMNVRNVGETGELIAFTLRVVNATGQDDYDLGAFDGVTQGMMGITGQLHQETLFGTPTITADGPLATELDTHFLNESTEVVTARAPSETSGLVASNEASAGPDEIAPMATTSYGSQLTGAFAIKGTTTPIWNLAQLVIQRDTRVTLDFVIAGRTGITRRVNTSFVL